MTNAIDDRCDGCLMAPCECKPCKHCHGHATIRYGVPCPICDGTGWVGVDIGEERMEAMLDDEREWQLECARAAWGLP